MTKNNPCFDYAQTLGSRKKQEDYIKIRVDISSKNDTRYLMLVTDGMGGYAAGDLASELAAEAFVSNYSFDKYQYSNNLNHALSEANKKLSDEIILNTSLRGMGTTLIAASIFDDALTWVSVGDSILWLFRDGKIHRLNDDHSMRPILSTKVTEKELENHPQRHQLRSVLNGSKIKIINISPQAFELKNNDLIIVASDGVLSLESTSIEKILNTYTDFNPKLISNKILSEVKKLKIPNQDNSSIAIYHHQKL